MSLMACSIAFGGNENLGCSYENSFPTFAEVSASLSLCPFSPSIQNELIV